MTRLKFNPPFHSSLSKVGHCHAPMLLLQVIEHGWDVTSVRVSAQLISMLFTWMNSLRSHCWFRTLHCVVQDLLHPLLLRISLMLLQKGFG
jgi:hypothetical protein